MVRAIVEVTVIAAVVATFAGCSADGDQRDAPVSPARASSPPNITARLVANTIDDPVAKGFDVGVLFAIEEGWHIYWDNPGDAGMPTRVDLKAPRGYTVGPVQYPGPHRFESAGDIVSYGYESSALLVSRVRADATVDVAAETLVTAEVRWLACKEACIPGRATLELVIPANGVTPSADDRALFAAWQAALPRPWAVLVASHTASWVVEHVGSELQLAITVAGADGLELFPSRHEGVRLTERIQTIDGARRAHLAVAFQRLDSGAELAADRIGVLAVESSGESRYYSLP